MPVSHKWYKRKVWTQKLRPNQLERKPFCEICRTALAEHVHHIQPFGPNNWRLFIDPRNHQSLCRRCHSSITHGRYGIAKGTDEHGMPIDPRHPWNQEERIAAERTFYRERMRFGSK